MIAILLIIITFLVFVIGLQHAKIITLKENYKVELKTVEIFREVEGNSDKEMEEIVGQQAFLIRKHYQLCKMSIKISMKYSLLWSEVEPEFITQLHDVYLEGNGSYGWSENALNNDQAVVWLFKNNFLVRKRKA
jgi:hypothetical protein